MFHFNETNCFDFFLENEEQKQNEMKELLKMSCLFELGPNCIIDNVQDGAGRVGKMLFARQGKKFDYDLKQVNGGFIFSGNFSDRTLFLHILMLN